MGLLRKTVALHLVAALALVGCRAFDESLLDGGGADAGPSCPLNRPADRPDDATDGDDGETYFYALRDALIDQRDERWRTVGYDLDGRCTTETNGDYECLPPSPSAPPETDGEGGTDNVLGHQVFEIILVAMEGIDEELRMYQTEGTGALLLQIRGWNGEDDDPRVEAVLSLSIFATTRRPDRVDSYSTRGRMLTINGEVYPFAAWEGEDWWYADATNYLGGDPESPRTVDSNAYIVDRTLVMRIPDRFPLGFRGDSRATQFLLSDSTLTAKISDDSMTIEEGVLAGRFSVLDMLDTIVTAGICRGTPDYMAFARLLDLAADVRLVPGTGGPGAVCDALSVGLVFERGSRARLGGVVEPQALDNPCLGMDGGVPDAGGVDGGVPADGGMMDGGVPADGGGMDGGAMTTDAGVTVDGGDADGG